MTEKCGALTKSGQPCKITRLAVARGFWPVSIVYEAAACHIHATPEERSEYKRIAAAIRAEEEREILAFHQATPVECWNWTVTEDDRRRAAEARDCDDPEQARTLAWNLLADWQGERCAICKGRSQVLDHDHKTGLARGWLCVHCNAKEGHADVPGGCFERYRQRNPASILGLTIRYYSPITGWAEPAPPPLLYEESAAYALGEIFAAGAARSPGYLLATYLADGSGE